MNSKLALGTVQFGIPYGISNKHGQLSMNEISTILKFASNSGVSLLDTAIAYGESENVLGKILKQNSQSFKVVTKISAIDNVKLQVEGSLKRLGQTNLYGTLFHDTDAVFKNLSSAKQLDLLKSNDVIQKVGYSLYHPDQLEKLFDFGVTIDLVQVPYNILDQRFKPYFAELKKRGVEIHVRSVFLQGIFFLNPQLLESKFDDIKSNIMAIQKLSKDEGLPLASMPLCFAVLEDNIDQVVIGVESLQNLKENIESLQYLEKVQKLSNELLKLECNNSKMILPTNWK